MRFNAKYFFNGKDPIRTNISVFTNDLGVVTSIEDCNEDVELAQQGVLMPAMFNAHTHIEYAGQTIEKCDGLIDFILQMKRNNNKLNVKDIEEQMNDFYNQGINFCADLCNSEKTILPKKKSKLLFHSFVEIFKKDGDDENETIWKYINLYKEFLKNDLQVSIVPHSLYALTPKIEKYLKLYNVDNKDITSIHFKESYKEDNMQMMKAELYKHHNISNIGNDFNKSISQDLNNKLLQIFDHQQRIILVHSIYMTEKEARSISNTFKNSVICLCPQSNIFIEKRMIEKRILQYFKNRIILGTDSSASNEKMSLVNEMFLCQNYFNLQLEEVLSTTTSNAANFFQIETMGTIEIGKKPGFVLLKNFNEREMRILENSTVTRLL
jgi:aminodeoxyfutalosine deaminase